MKINNQGINIEKIEPEGKQILTQEDVGQNPVTISPKKPSTMTQKCNQILGFKHLT